MTADLLTAIVAGARRSALERERAVRRSEFQRAIDRTRPRGDALMRSLRDPGLHVIAECKRRSPSKGVLRRAYDPAAIAAAYAAAGAAAISVLTEPAFFDGALDHLTAVRAAVDAPVLRKDFIVSEFQVAESRAAGADAVLLIAGALSDAELQTLTAAAASHGLAALVEAHDRTEIDRAAAAGARLIGVNSRNLRTLEVDVSLFETLAPHLPEAVVAVAESGLRTHADLTRLAALGYRAFLVGERLVTEAEPGDALRALLGQNDGVERPTA